MQCSHSYEMVEREVAQLLRKPDWHLLSDREFKKLRY
jgi:hypothetical protein